MHLLDSVGWEVVKVVFFLVLTITAKGERGFRVVASIGWRKEEGRGTEGEDWRVMWF